MLKLIVKRFDIILNLSKNCNNYLFDGETERQRDRETERQRDRETERQRDRETERQRDRETERQRAERQRDRETVLLYVMKVLEKFIFFTLFVTHKLVIYIRSHRYEP
jgi:hypothetical protein